jgi:hypothetical protein
MVEVAEHPGAPVFLPPLGGDRVGTATLELTCERNRGGPHLDRVVAGFEPGSRRVCRRAPSSWGSRPPRLRGGARGLRPPLRAPFPESPPAGDRGRCEARRRARDPWTGSARRGSRDSRGSPPRRRGRCRPRRAPRRSCRSGSIRRPSAASRARSWERASGRTTGRLPLRGALHQDRPPADRPQDRLLEREVVAHEVELRLAPLREVDLARTRDRDPAARGFDLHPPRLPRPCAVRSTGLSRRIPVAGPPGRAPRP